MGRAPCCDKANVKKGPWSPEEDAKLKEFMEKYGTGGNWIALPQKAGLKRCGKSCRLRWLNYLRPNIKHGEFSDDEDKIICTLYATIGSRWSIIAAQLPGRTDNDIKNYWNTKLKKKLMGMIPSKHSHSHLPFSNIFHTQTQPTHSLSTTLSQLYSSFHLHSAKSSLNPVESLPPPRNLLYCNNPDTFSLTTTSQYPYYSQNQEDLADLHYCNGKDSSSNMLMFGGNEVSCSSSDGSCGKDQVKREEVGCGLHSFYSGFDQESQGFMVHDGMSGFVDEKGNGGWDSSALQLRSEMEEVKQLIISSGGHSNGNNVNSTSFLFNHDEREMHYY